MAEQLASIDRISRLRAEEERLRQRLARRLELEPTRREAANVLFRRASGLRKVRLALLRRWNLV